MKRKLLAAFAGSLMVALAGACIPVARPGVWHPAGSLTSIPEVDSLVPLPDGQAFVTGHGQAAVFNPTSGTWKAAASAPEVLAAPGTVALRDGTVLVFGGRVGNTAVSDALVYRPDKDRWERTGSMTTPRYGFAATVLPDGRVLVTGGGDEGKNSLATAEIYDPTRHAWASTGSMAVPRYLPSTALAGDGRIIVIDGYRSIDSFNPMAGNFPVSDVEAFEPRSGRWSELPRLALDLSRITLLSMKGGRLIGLGGADGRTQVSAVQIFDPVTNRWQQVAPMNRSAGSVRGAVLDDSRVVVVGIVFPTAGRGFRSTTVGGEVYDPDTNLWLPISVRTNFLVQMSTKLAGGQLLAVGLAEPGLKTAVWDPNGYPPLPGAEGPLASGPLAVVAATVAALLILVFAVARVRAFAWRRGRR